MHIELHTGDREALRPLFELAEYQRLGFRMRSVERDAFTPANGYPPGLEVGGIELRDRVWLDLRLDAG